MTRHISIKPEISFSISRSAFNADYTPSASTRATTNFANLARGPQRQENLRKTLKMMNNRLNALADQHNDHADRYALSLEIISVAMTLGGEKTIEALPLIEMLDTSIIDHKENIKIKGMTGNSFSSYLRDYDFSLLMGQLLAKGSLPDDFGALHGRLFQHFTKSAIYAETFAKAPVICLSASTSQTYHATGFVHPVLGKEYRQQAPSRTDLYFAKMGCKVRFFMPKDSVAPLAFYTAANLLEDYSALELISCIATMESFQKIYRPEIYNANARAGALYRPSLTHQDYSLTQVVYDREERSQLALSQALFAQEHLVKPYGAQLAAWAAYSR